MITRSERWILMLSACLAGTGDGFAQSKSPHIPFILAQHSPPPSGGDALQRWCRGVIYRTYGRADGADPDPAKRGSNTPEANMYDAQVLEPKIDTCVRSGGRIY